MFIIIYLYLWSSTVIHPVQVSERVRRESRQCDVASLVLHDVHLHGALELRGVGAETVRQVAVEGVLLLLVRFTDSPRVQAEQRTVSPHLVDERLQTPAGALGDLHLVCKEEDFNYYLISNIFYSVWRLSLYRYEQFSSLLTSQ